MRIIVLNGKKLGLAIVMVGLMMVLLGFGKHFEDKLKMSTLVQNNIDTLKEYNGLNNKFNYKLPDNWTTSEKNFSGGEIIYHNDFQSEDAVIYGIVQEWKIKEDLKSFLEKSKAISEKQNDIKNYKIDTIDIGAYKGYVVRYADCSSGNCYRVYEYFIQNNGDEFVRFSFFVRDKNFKENMPYIFETITKTLKYN